MDWWALELSLDHLNKVVPMIAITTIEVIVSDIDRAKKWYTKCLGARITKEYKRWKCAEIVLGDSTVELDIGEPLKSWGEDEYGKAKKRIGTVTGIDIEVDDIKN